MTTKPGCFSIGDYTVSYNTRSGTRIRYERSTPTWKVNLFFIDEGPLSNDTTVEELDAIQARDRAKKASQ